jgi:hypothetical protein
MSLLSLKMSQFVQGESHNFICTPFAVKVVASRAVKIKEENIDSTHEGLCLVQTAKFLFVMHYTEQTQW